jgi:metal-responsive CopG/Arc/MetJ family transcriptional regulator
MPITLDLPEALIKEIEKYQKDTNKPSKEEAIIELLQYALTLPEYFRAFEWEKAEEEADEEIATGEIATFESVDEFLDDLKA